MENSEILRESSGRRGKDGKERTRDGKERTRDGDMSEIEGNLSDKECEWINRDGDMSVGKVGNG